MLLLRLISHQSIRKSRHLRTPFALKLPIFLTIVAGWGCSISETQCDSSNIVLNSQRDSDIVLKSFGRSLPLDLLTFDSIINVIFRSIYLGVIFSPALFTIPVKFLFPKWTYFCDLWWRICRYCICQSGPCITKFCQWVSVRPDLFPEEVCANLTNLQSDTSRPTWKDVKSVLRQSYNKNYESLFEIEFDERNGLPIVLGSGCVAQVLKGTAIQTDSSMNIRSINNSPNYNSTNVQNNDIKLHREAVAVKVTHPNVRAAILADVQLLRLLASTCEVLLPGSKVISLSESVEEFRLLMLQQLDMQREADSLARFRRNFSTSSRLDYAAKEAAEAGREMSVAAQLFASIEDLFASAQELWRQCRSIPSEGLKETGAYQPHRVTFPAPWMHLTTSNVLVESFADGWLLRDLLNHDSLVGEEAMSEATKKEIARIGLHAIFKMIFIDNFIHADLHPGNIVMLYPQSQRASSQEEVTLCFLDAGLVVSLTAQDRRNFEDLFVAVVRNDGPRVGRLMMERSVNSGRGATDPVGFISEIGALVNAVHASGLSLRKIGIGSLLTSVLQLCYKHQVKLEARYTSVIVALGVMEGLGRQLDPDVDILSVAAPYVLHAAATRTMESLGMQ